MWRLVGFLAMNAEEVKVATPVEDKEFLLVVIVFLTFGSLPRTEYPGAEACAAPYHLEEADL